MKLFLIKFQIYFLAFYNLDFDLESTENKHLFSFKQSQQRERDANRNKSCAKLLALALVRQTTEATSQFVWRRNGKVPHKQSVD